VCACVKCRHTKPSEEERCVHVWSLGTQDLAGRKGGLRGAIQKM